MPKFAIISGLAGGLREGQEIVKLFEADSEEEAKVAAKKILAGDDTAESTGDFVTFSLIEVREVTGFKIGPMEFFRSRTSA